MKRLLTLNNARAVFTNAFTAVANASRFCDLTDINVAQTTQTLSHCPDGFNRFAKNQLKKLNSRPTIEDPQEKCLGKISKLTFKMSN